MATWTLDPAVDHLNHGSFGACPVEVLELQRELRTAMERNPIRFMMRDYQPALEESRAAISSFLGTDADGLVFVPNATYGVNSALRSIEDQISVGQEILITSHTYNACRNAAVVTAERRGASVVVADIPFPLVDPAEAVTAVLDAVTAQTAVVMLDHVTSPTALVLPIAEILAGLDPSIVTIIDGAHAPGMLAVDLATLGADFYTANCHKWVCAPKGAAILWVAEPHRATAMPASISHGYNDGWHGSGSRFHAQFDWAGTDDPSPRLCISRSLAVLAAHRVDGWAGIRASNRQLALDGRSVLLEALGATAPAPESMIGSIASVVVPADPTATGQPIDPLMTALHQNWSIEVPVWEWGSRPLRLLRISAQQYNSIEQYHRLADALGHELAVG